MQEKCKIYLLTNKANNKIYVGQTWLSLNKRIGNEGEGYRNSTYLYNAIKKYGVDQFEYSILAECDNQEEADKLESEFIEKYDSRNSEIGYNIKFGGSVGKHSEETKRKISESQMGEKSYWFGKHVSEETKQKLSEAMSGRTLTPEHKEKVIPTLKFGGFEGYHHSEESKTKISEKNKGRIIPMEKRARKP